MLFNVNIVEDGEILIVYLRVECALKHAPLISKIRLLRKYLRPQTSFGYFVRNAEIHDLHKTVFLYSWHLWEMAKKLKEEYTIANMTTVLITC